MQALREIVKVKNHEIRISLPAYFNDNEELEVIVLPKEESNRVNEENVLSDIFMKDCGEFLHPINREYIYDGER